MTAVDGHHASLDFRLPRKRKLKRWLRFGIGTILFLILGFAFLAPVLMKTGYTDYARRIYKTYRLACHQLAYRSYFLFGAQAVYPLELAGIKDLQTFEQATGKVASDTKFASEFVGDDRLGYKVALCQRDIAIYAAMLFFILLYSVTGKKIKALPWWLWISLAILPIGLDGFWQLISQLEWPFLAWIPDRESTPFLRVLTGSLFGFLSMWFILPTLENDDPLENDIEPDKMTDHLMKETSGTGAFDEKN